MPDGDRSSRQVQVIPEQSESFRFAEAVNASEQPQAHETVTASTDPGQLARPKRREFVIPRRIYAGWQ
jgi:hypothetical protein